MDGPVQPATVGVTVTVEVTGEPLVLFAVNAGVLPAPLAAKPIEVLEFVQAKEPPAGVLVKAEAATDAP